MGRPTAKVSRNTVGGRIQSRRLDMEMSQKELAKLVGVIHRETISDWERGLYVPSLLHIEKLADALGVLPAWLAWGNRLVPRYE